MHFINRKMLRYPSKPLLSEATNGPHFCIRAQRHVLGLHLLVPALMTTSFGLAPRSMRRRNSPKLFFCAATCSGVMPDGRGGGQYQGLEKLNIITVVPAKAIYKSIKNNRSAAQRALNTL